MRYVKFKKTDALRRKEFPCGPEPHRKERLTFKACELKDKFCPSATYRTRSDQSKHHKFFFPTTSVLVGGKQASLPYLSSFTRMHTCTLPKVASNLLCS